MDEQYILEILATSKVARKRPNPIRYKSPAKNVFVTHDLLDPQDYYRTHKPSPVQKTMAWNQVKSMQERATFWYGDRTSLITVCPIFRDGEKAIEVAQEGHLDAVFKAFIDIFLFKEHYMYPHIIDEAILQSRVPDTEDWQVYAMRQQYKAQFSQLQWS